MYTEISPFVLINSEEIAGIFDLDNTTVNKFTKDFLNRARREGKVSVRGEGIPKSFVLTDKGDVILATLSPRALKKRINFI